MKLGEWIRLAEEQRDRGAEVLYAAALAAARRAVRAAGLPSSDADDLAQRAVLAVLSGAADSKRASDSVALGAWVGGVVANMARGDARRLVVESRPPARRGPSLERRMAIARERAAIVSCFPGDALESLTDRQSYALRPWAEGASYAAIGDLLGVRGDTARDLVHRALDAARRFAAGRRTAPLASAPVSYPPLATVSHLALTSRQLAVYALAAAGRTLDWIAQSIHVCREAARSVLRRIWRRLASVTGAGEATTTPQESRDKKVEQRPFDPEAAMINVVECVREPKSEAWTPDGRPWARRWTDSPAPAVAAKRRPPEFPAKAIDLMETWTTSSAVRLRGAAERANSCTARAATRSVLVLAWTP